MKVERLVTFSGVTEKMLPHLDRMLADDIAAYPARIAIDAATISEPVKVEPAVMPKPKPRSRKR